MMVKSNPVQLLRESHTRALFVPEKSPFEAKKRFCKVLLNVFQGQTKVFLGSKGHTWTETIAKTKKNIRVSHTKVLLFF